MIKKAIKYGSTGCGMCMTVERNLKSAGIPVESINLDEEDDDFIEEHRIGSVPTVDFVDETGVVVFRKAGLLTVPQIKDIVNGSL